MSQNHPHKATLEKGKEYYYCTCGKSTTGPFCSGAHKGTDKNPIKFKAEKDGDAYLCGCQKSGNSPFCDGSHKK